MTGHKALPTVETIKKLLSYDPDTGEFRWLPRTDRCHSPAGSIAGGLTLSKYRQISIFNEKYLAHRLAWKYVYGVEPSDQIDHINNDPSDNRICNLRIATQSQNFANKRRKASSKYPKGVSLVLQAGKVSYRAQAGSNGRAIYIGTFATVQEASAAYLAKAIEIHGEFSNVG